MGKRRRSFSEPKYEINIESKDRVLIRQEKINPLWHLLKQIMVISIIVYAAMLASGFVYNLTSYLLLPSRITILPVYCLNAEQPSAQSCEGINVYIDGRKKPLRKKITANGISVPFRRRGEHIIGIENVNSRMDSIAFAREKSLLDSLDLSKRKRDVKNGLHDFIFHKVVSEQDFDTSRFLYFIHRKPFAKKTQLIFLSKGDESSIMFGQAVAKNLADNSALVRDFRRALYSRVSVYSPNVDQITDDFLDDLKSYAVDIPHLNELVWFSENRMKRFRYADDVRQLLRSSVFILPFIEKNLQGEIFVKLVLSFADVGAIEFEPIEIRNIALNEMSILPSDAVVFEIIAVYLRIYYSFLSSGTIDESHLRDFIALCNRNSPNVDALDRVGNRIMRLSSVPKKVSIVQTLGDFFTKIEHLQCRALYDELADFWQNDPYDLGSFDQFNSQEKEVVRAIIKWTLALKENKHRCAENEWPNADQRLTLFYHAKKSIDEMASLSWLHQEPLYAVLQAEITNLDHNF